MSDRHGSSHSAATMPPRPAFAADLEQLLQLQRARWQGGERPAIEQLLAEQTSQADNPEIVLHLIFNEVILREQAGEQPVLADYRERFPHLAEQLEVQFALDRAVQDELLAAATVEAAPHIPESEKRRGAGEHPVIPGYEVLDELGHGGMGVVYRAWQTGLNRMVALKMILAGPHAGDVHRARFRIEAEAVARLQHPNIVQIHDWGEHEGRPYFGLEYVDGGSLDRRLNGIPQPPRDAAAVIETLARAMHYAHQKGIVHRDLKPANILVEASRPQVPPQGDAQTAATLSLSGELHRAVVKITDFGLAKILVGGEEQTQSGAILGTPSYMAPEQATGNTREVGPAVDVWALGAMLYEMLTGRPPFKGPTPLDTMMQVCSLDPVRPTQMQPRTPRDLETITLKCLQKDPKKRYGSAAALAEDLRRFLAREPILARPTPAWERAVKWARRRPVAAALLGFLVFACLGMLFLGWQWYESELTAARHGEQVVRQQLRENKRVNDVQGKAQDFIGKGKLAQAKWQAQKRLEDLRKAESHFASAFNLVAHEAALPKVKAQAEVLLEGTRLDIKAAEAWQRDQQKSPQVVQYGDAASEFATKVIPQEQLENVRELRRKAPKGPALFGIAVDEPEKWDPADFAKQLAGFSKKDRSEIIRQCYTALLLFADAEAFPLPGENRQEQARKAVRILDLAARLPQSPTRAYHLYRARYLEQAGNRQQAAAERQRAAAPALTDDALGHYLLGMEQFNRKAYREAIKSFEDALRLEPKHFWSRFQLAHSCLQAGRLVEAANHFSACLDHRKDHIWTHVVLGHVHAELGSLAERSAEAIRRFRSAEESFQRAEKLLPQLTDERKTAAQYMLAMNRGALRLRQAEAARLPGHLRAVAGQFPQAYLAVRQVAQLWRRHYLEEALKDFKAGAKIHPDWHQTYLNLAVVNEKLGKLDALDALVARYRKADLYRVRARLYRERAVLHLRRSDHAAGARDLEAARDDLLKAIRREMLERKSPVQLAEDHRQLGLVLLKLSEYPRAVRAFDSALSLHIVLQAAGLSGRRKPAVVAIHRWRAEALYELANLEEQQGNPRAYQRHLKEAVASLDRYLARAIQSLQEFVRAKEPEPVASTCRFRGMLQAKLGHLEAALADFTLALTIQPDSQGYAFRGGLYLMNNTPQAALADFREALRLDPHNANAHTGLASVRVLQNDHVQATANAEIAVELDGKSPRTLYTAARVYALAAARVTADPAYRGPQGRHKKAHYERRALELLSQALAQSSGAERVRLLRNIRSGDSALQSLRRSAEMPRMLGDRVNARY